MSRSRNKKPVLGHGGFSEKKDKRKFNRSHRYKIKECIKKGRPEDIPKRPEPKSSSGNWLFAKDGKTYYTQDRIRRLQEDFGADLVRQMFAK